MVNNFLPVGNWALTSGGDYPARQAAAVNEQYPFRLEGVTQRLHGGGHDRLALLESQDGAPADAGGSGQIGERPFERRPSHPALPWLHPVASV